MGFFSKSKELTSINWKTLQSIDQLEDVVALSKQIDVVLFKHSTRCAISSMAKSRLERDWDMEDGPEMYYLDLLQYRNVSNQIALVLGVEHQSPQIILLRDGVVIYNDSHHMISVSALKEHL